MPTTARFEIRRQRHLKLVFQKKRLIKLWRELVRNQMRSLEVQDIHDYYDFNYNIEERINDVIERVLTGQYRAETPLIYRAEKKFGICRHMMVPSPSDTLVFQALTDILYRDVMKAQPSKSAYYARDRHSPGLPHQHEDAGSYPWFLLWPKFQTEIWKFARAHDVLVTTDITNYFDNIGLRELRHVISSVVKAKEVCLDLLFSLIEDLSWNPDYLPTSHKGLPTINIEAPRLLAHAFLFDVDHVLKKRTKSSFARWMDDMNFGVDDERAAFQILGEINDVLKSRGLALNLAKTTILSREEAEAHFLFSENVRLSQVLARAKKLKTTESRKRLASDMARELRKHLKQSHARNKNKVTKRYFYILQVLQVPIALTPATELFALQPELREPILRYLSSLPFSKSVARAFLTLHSETEFYDDATLFGIVKALVQWPVPYSKAGREFVASTKRSLRRGKSAFEWFCLCYFLAKYGEPHEVLNAVAQCKWKKQAFFARQQAAILPRGLVINSEAVIKRWNAEVSSGLADSASVAHNLRQFATMESNTDFRLRTYLFPSKKQRPYPMAKFLLLCTLAYNDTTASEAALRRGVREHVNDDWYLRWLKQLRPAWFSYS